MENTIPSNTECGPSSLRLYAIDSIDTNGRSKVVPTKFLSENFYRD